jgi:hypothetical protein
MNEILPAISAFFWFDVDRVLCRSRLIDCELPENHYFLHLFRYGKIRHKGSKRNYVGRFMNFMKIVAGCAVCTGINEITFMGVV